VVRWGADVLHVTHRSPPDSFVLGESARAPSGYALPAAVLGAQRASLVRVDRARREVWLVVVPRASGTIELEGAPAATLRSWIDAGRARRYGDVPGAWEVEIPRGCRATVELGELAFDVSLGRDAWPADGWAAEAPLRQLTVRGLVSAAVTLALHAGPLGAVAFASPHLACADASVDSSQLYILQRTFSDAWEREPERPEEAATIEGDDRDRLVVPEEEEHAPFGDPRADVDGHEYGIRGVSDNPDPHIARDLWPAYWEAPEWILAVPRIPRGGDPDAPIARWGREDSFGNDEQSARGNTWGDRIGTSFGSLYGGESREPCAMCPRGDGRGPRLRLNTKAGGPTGTEAATPASSLNAIAASSERRR
jgi:hypothetical protein